MSSAPLLADVTVDGKPRKVVAVPSKQAWLYVFDRVTGEPIWPIEEKPVPKGDVPGEWYSPTQPHPAEKLRYARNFFNVPDDLIDFTPELRAEALERVEAVQVGPDTVQSAAFSATSRDLLERSRSARPRTGRAAATIPSCISRLRPLATQPEHAIDGRAAARSSRTSGTSRASAGSRSAKCWVLAIAAPRIRRAPRSARAKRSGCRRAGRAGPRAGPASQAAIAAAAGLNVQGLPIVKPPYGLLAAINLDRGRGRVADTARRHAGQHPQSPGAQGHEHPEDGPGRHVGRGSAGHEDAGHHGRSAGDDDAAASARRDAARVRQDRRASRSARCGCPRRRAGRR